MVMVPRTIVAINWTSLADKYTIHGQVGWQTTWNIMVYSKKMEGSFIFDKINYGGGTIQLSQEESRTKDQGWLVTFDLFVFNLEGNT